MMRRAWWAATMTLGLLLALSPAPVRATTVVPVPDAELVQSATAIVVARVLAIQTSWLGAARQVVTDVAVAVDEVLAGDVPSRTVTVRLPGGRLGDLDVRVDGTPGFRQGETVLLFLSTGRDGRLRVAHLSQGKFSVVVDGMTGEELALRAPADGVNVVGRGAGAAAMTPDAGEVRRLEDVRRLVRGLRGHARSGPAVPAAATSDATVSQSSGAFTFLGAPSRWFEPDTGEPVTMLLDENGEPAASTRGFSQVRDGYAVWSGVAGSAFRFRDGGFTTARGYAFDGVNAVSFRDPQGQIDPPTSCSGTLALTVFFRTMSETRTVNGQTFNRIVEADVVFADGWQGCGFYESYANLAEVATHELGHVLGLGHSENADATMAAVAHFDGRGAALRDDDRAGVVFAYPAPAALTVTRAGTGSGTVTSSPAGISCGTDCTEVYANGTVVTLAAAPAAGSTFAGWSGGGCSGTGSCTVRMSASTTVTATFTSTAVASFTASFSAPADGATVRYTLSVGMTTSAPWGQTKTFTLAMDGAVLTSQTTTGTTLWYNWNTRTVPDGPHTLTLRVTYSGQTATATRTVNVANGGTTMPALTASFTSPAAGATVSSTTTVGMSAGGASGSVTFTLTIDGATVFTQSAAGTTASYAWDTRTAANGTHTLGLTVTDGSGRTASTTRTVTVSNTTPGTASFTASFSAPAEGATVRYTLSIGMTTSAPWGRTKTFTLAIDGQVVTSQTTTGTTLWYNWNTRTAANGQHTLTLTVTYNGQTATATRNVTVRN